MASSITQQLTKRLVKQKEQFSPSNPPGTAKYHLIVYDDNGLMMIVGNSSVKRFGNDGLLIMNGGRTAKLIISGNFSSMSNEKLHGSKTENFNTLGTKDICINQWNKQTRSSKGKIPLNLYVLNILLHI